MSGGQRCGSGSVDLYPSGSGHGNGHLEEFHCGAEFVGAGNDPGLPGCGDGPQRKHVGQNRRMLLFGNLEIGRAVVGSRLGMIKGLMLSRGNRLLKIVGTEVVEQSRPGGSSGIQAEFFCQAPGNVRNIQAVEKPGGVEMLLIADQFAEFPVPQNIIHAFQKL